MSNLNRPYEISVWDDILEGEEFVEKRLGVIGSDKMLSQSRALNPQLGRNVNGTKTFQFEMYRYYTDNITGKRVENPFSGWLISERKVKLKYAGKWHDFIIKDISENSSTYLYTYKLEDAAVIELSKNGFGVILDELNNNLGNPKTLAERVLEDTDWKVKSEVVVQKVEDALVHVTIPVGTMVVHLLDQTNLNEGVQEIVTTIDKKDADRVEILAFYSSCTNKPHRFQFIYLDDLADITTDKEGKINNTNCQYYIDLESPENDYYKVENTPFFLPKDFSLYYKNRGYLYTDARAERYGFAHQTEYIPKLDRYVYKYTKDNEPRYGYYDSEYYSPALIQSIVTNSRFDSTSGWTGTRSTVDGVKATVRNVYGYFNLNNEFIDSADELLQGTFDPGNDKLAAYLEITLGDNSLVLNSGPYDNRIIIGNMEQGSEWQLEQEIYTVDGTRVDGTGVDSLSIQIGEYDYDSNDYYKSQSSNITFSQTNPYKVTTSSYQEKTFKKDSKVRIAITGASGTYYIKKFELFRRILDDNQNVIYPDNIVWLENEQKWDGNINQSVVKNTYRYFTQSAFDKATDATDLVPEYTTETLSYAIYKPIYNTGAEKIRTVSAKESNYFNILQSIAETFGAWLEIDVKHNEDGSIDKENKWVKFKNYVGKTNYANFRYGVNLKDIQRTFASKEIVTKLMVKPNSNQHAINGFCAIGRADSNPSGEDCIYDFRYFHKKGLLDNNKYLEDVYVPNVDEDYTSTTGYYYKIKQLNTNINILNNEKIIPTQTNLTQLKSEYAVAEAGYDAALEGIKEAREDFEQLFGFSIDNVSADCINSVIIDETNSYKESWHGEDRYGHIWYQTTNGFEITKVEYEESTQTIKITYNTIESGEQKFILGESIYVELYPQLVLKYNNEKTHKTLKATIKPDKYGTAFIDIQIGGTIDKNNSTAINKIVEYTTLRGNEKLYHNQKEELSQKIGLLKQELAKNEEELDTQKENKSKLNLAFFKKYSRFIQEGTWIDEKYSDDELYYADALSVMYNSCYPKVAYTINVLALNMLPGYEGFTFELGDTTYAEDPEFFDNKKEEVVITELIEFLDEPDKDTIKVQNFKNQFKDLFQKITATVQQAQYNTGSYEKAVALAEANQTRKQQFLSDALNSASARLSAAGQQSVVWDNTGLTITDIDTPSNQIKMIGGAILLKKQDENGQDKWTTGITSDGISASLITAGTINAGEIAIMNAKEPVFRWDAFGISAFDFIAQENDFGTTIGAINPKKFVRFDKYGIYGIDGTVDGMTWHATSMQEAEDKATFALTWEGLKVTGDEDTIAHIGKQDSNIISIKKGKDNILTVSNDGRLVLEGIITATSGKIGECTINSDGSIVSADGLFQILNTGGIIAKKGNISGWIIDETKMYALVNVGIYDKDTYGFCMVKPDENKDNNNIVLAIGSLTYNNWEEGEFLVYRDGQVFAKEINANKTIIDNAIINQKLGFGLIKDGNEPIFTTTLDKEGITLDTTDKQYYYKNYLNNEALIHEWWHSIEGNEIGGAETNKTIFGKTIIDEQPFFGIKTSLNVGNCRFWSIDVDNGAQTFVSIDFHMDEESSGCYGQFYGTWMTEDGFSISSDKNLKNSIEDLSNKYEMFYENLNPVRFKYNNGRSGRYHTGFIAQEVHNAILNSGLDTNELAAYVKFIKTNKDGASFTSYALRYEEFISLNTWQIQKLKPRMTAAEEKIQQLELEVAELKQELATFKNQ